MKIEIKNVGIWKNASMVIDGITIIAGRNGTGKSTFGKTLFAVFNTLYNFDERILSAKKRILKRQIQSSFSLDTLGDDRFMYHKLSSVLSLDELLQKDFYKKLDNIKNVPKSVIVDLKDRLSRVINLSEDQIGKNLMFGALFGEFGDQIKNVHAAGIKETANIKLTITGNVIDIDVDNGEVDKISNRMSLGVRPIYLDDITPLILSTHAYGGGYFSNMLPRHMIEMAKLIRGYEPNETDAAEKVIDTLLQNDKLTFVRKRLNEICHGYLKDSNDGLKFVDVDNGVQYSINNIASGLKTFLILEDLILNNSLQEKGLLILDEPETHLHPEWQLIFAELIVLLQKAFNLHILIATHSPYFIGAIDAYSKKHGTIDRGRYYFAQMEDKELVLDDVTKRIATIYDSLSRPYQEIENIERSLKI